MPNYIFKHPTKDIYVEVFQHMNDEHIYEQEGIKWLREYTIPQAQIDVTIDPRNPRDFCEKTAKKNYNLGQVMDLSAEQSEKRAKSDGIDKVKEKTYKDYEKKTGTRHPLKPKPKIFEI